MFRFKTNISIHYEAMIFASRISSIFITFLFFMRIKRFDLKKSRQNAITVAYEDALCNSVTQSKFFNNRVTNTN